MNKIPLPFFFAGVIIFFIFILALIAIVISVTVEDETTTPKIVTCQYNGPTPTPLANEIIGASPPLTLFSTKSETSFIVPCFVYFTNDIHYEKTIYGIRLPIGTYNIYVQYLSLEAIDGDVVTDRLIQTSFHDVQDNFISEGFVAGRTASFESSKAMTEYNMIELKYNSNTIRLESATKGFSANTLEIDRIEILFEKV